MDEKTPYAKEQEFERKEREKARKQRRDEMQEASEQRRKALRAGKRSVRDEALRVDWDAEIDVRDMDRMPNDDGTDAYPHRTGKCNIRCGCDRAVTFKATLYDLQKLDIRTCCPQCTREERKDAFKDAVEERGGKVLGKIGLGSLPVAVECAAGHAFSIVPHLLLHNHIWCKDCLRPKASASAQRLEDEVTALGGTLVTPYVKSNEPVQIQCGRGHTWSVTPSVFLANNRWCKECARIAGTTMTGVPRKAKTADASIRSPKSQEVVDRIIAAAADRGGEMVGPYVQSMQPITLRCAAGHEWQTTPNVFLQHGRWCRVCAALTNTTLTGRKRKAREVSKS